MRTPKCRKYAIEQVLIQKQIIGMLNLEEGFYLYEMDRDRESQKQIMDMVPEIWKYFAHMNVTGLLYPERCKRPWLSIVRGVLKNRYRLKYKACRFLTESGSVYTMKYYAERLDDSLSRSSSLSNSSENWVLKNSASSDSLTDQDEDNKKISLNIKRKEVVIPKVKISIQPVIRETEEQEERRREIMLQEKRQKRKEIQRRKERERKREIQRESAMQEAMRRKERQERMEEKERVSQRLRELGQIIQEKDNIRKLNGIEEGEQNESPKRIVVRMIL